MAKELDDYEADLTADDTEAIIEVAEIVPIQPSSPSHGRRPSTPTLLSIAPPNNPSTSPMAHIESQFVFPPAVEHLKEKEKETEDVPDTVSIRSSRSTKSLRARGDRTSSILAAKRRSHRVSQSSLRLTGRHSRKQSSIRFKPGQEDHPVPELPLHFTDNVIPTLTPYASSTMLVLDSRTPSLRRQGSLDSIYRSPVTSAASTFRGRSADDIYVRPYNPSSSSEIQLVSRSQACNFTTPEYERSVFETDTICDVPSKNDGS